MQQKLKIISFVIFILVSTIKAFQKTIYEIKDLQETEITLFEEEVEHWEFMVESSKAKKITSEPATGLIPIQFLLGGPDTRNIPERRYEPAFHRFYHEIPAHKTAIITGRFWIYNLELSKLPMQFALFSVMEVDPLVEVHPCLSYKGEGKRFFSINDNDCYPFSLSILNINYNIHLEIYSNFYSKEHPQKSFGFRELEIYFHNETIKASAGILCQIPEDLPSWNYSECLNNIRKTLGYENSKNQSCAKNCDACFGPEPTECFSCSVGTHWDGTKCNDCPFGCQICKDSSQGQCQVCMIEFYKYENGTCLKTCGFPFHEVESEGGMHCIAKCKSEEFVWIPKQICLGKCDPPLRTRVTEDGMKFCENPCMNVSDFLFWNGSCLSSCHPPLSQPNRFDLKIKFCKNPCNFPSQYLYADRSCSEECSAPFKVKSEPGVNYCVTSCSSDSQYLYNDGSCLANCPFPLHPRLKFGVRFCDNPCYSRSHYLYSNRSCLEKCPAPLQMRNESGVKYCINPCDVKSQYLYSNGSCHSTCPLPLKNRIDSGAMYCLQPCRKDEYILANGLCSAKCLSPLVKKIEPLVGTYCLSPCLSNEDFIYENGECTASCSGYLETRIEHGLFKYCLSPCLHGEYYFYQNKSCLQNCLYPLKIQLLGGLSICSNPCSFEDDSFLYSDQSCQKECVFPLMQRIEGGVKYCESPCVMEEDKYIYQDESCQGRCEYPYKIMKRGSYEICEIDLSMAQVLQINSIKIIVQTSNHISEIGGFLNSIFNPGDPTSLFMIPLLNMFEGVRLMEITLPANIKMLLLKEFDSGKIHEKSQDRFLMSRGDQLRVSNETSLHLQKIFDKRILLIGILCLVAVMFKGIAIFTQRNSKLDKFLEKCSFVFEWNILIPVYLCINNDIILYFLAETQSLTLSPTRLIICLILVMLTIFIILKIRNIIKKSKSTEDNIMQRWRFLYETYHTENAYQRYFVLIYLLRVISINVIIGCLFNYPRIQALSLLIISIGMCSYLISVSPISKTISRIQHLITEVLLMFYNILLAILATFEFADETKRGLGQLMNVLFLIVPFLTMILIIFKLLKDIYFLFFDGKILRDHIQLNQDSTVNEQQETNEITSDFEENEIEPYVFDE